MAQSVLRIKKIDDISLDYLSCRETSSFFGKFPALEWHSIDQCPWRETFPYQPEVRFQIAHSDRNIYLRYKVKEEYVKGQYIRPNENVWEDSCVEFFLSLDNKQHYYNFEFNVLGTGLVGYGTADKSTRHRLDTTVVERINTFTQVSKLNGEKAWEIVLAIPKDIFREELADGKVVHANFYKCGDMLPQPHFVALNAIENPIPNFHLPQYFGEVVFEK